MSRADAGVDADGGATGKGVVVVLLLLGLWQQASERGERGRMELQLKKQVKAAADIREGTSSEETGKKKRTD